MKNIKAILALALCLCMVLSLAACASTSPSPSTVGNGGGTSETPSGASEAPPVSNEEIELEFWHIWGSGDSNSASVEKVIADWEKAYPNIKIKVETFENDDYKKTNLPTAVSSDTLPDIFSTWGGGFSKSFVDGGKVLKLDEYLQDGTLDKLQSGALNNFTYNDGVYGMVFGKAASGFFVNKKLFEDNNVKIPTTYEELLTAVDAFKAVGITPIATTTKDSWVIGMLFEGIALKAVGAEQMNKDLNKLAGGGFTDPGYLLAANKIFELIEAGAFPENIASISRDECEFNLMQQGKAAMYYMGAWATGNMTDDKSQDKDNFTFIAFPTLADGKGTATEFNGGGADGLMINSKTEHPAEAAAFLKFFGENMAREAYQAGNYMPIWKGVEVDESKINYLMVDISNVTKDATNYILWWDTVMFGQDVTTYQEALNKMLLGESTPEDFVATLQTIK